jgi:hypothetical protein
MPRFFYNRFDFHIRNRLSTKLPLRRLTVNVLNAIAGLKEPVKLTGAAELNGTIN